MYRKISLIALMNGLLAVLNIYMLSLTTNHGNSEVTESEVVRGEAIPNNVDLNIYQTQGNLVLKSTGGNNETSVIYIEKNIQERNEYNQNDQFTGTTSKLFLLPARQFNTVDLFPKKEPVLEKKHSERTSGYKVPMLPTTSRINCEDLLSGSEKEIIKAKEITNQREFTKVPIYEETYLDWTQNCSTFKANRGYIEVPLSEDEKSFPIAFSISMFTDVEQVERLLRAVYQPQNLYCIHIDIKSSLLIHKTMRAIVNCFDNVFITSRNAKVKWGDVSVLLPHLSCMTDLVNDYQGKWQYFIDLAGQEFPLRTNYEIVQILKIFNGSNDITASHKRMEQDRIRFQWAYRWSRRYQQTILYNTFKQKTPPPFNLTVFKGEIHGLFSRRFVDFIVNNAVAQKFLEWCWDTSHASEHYWNTLNYNKHINAPGGYYGDVDKMEKYSLEPVTRAKHWQDENYIPRECQGKLVRGICVYGIGDLPWLSTRKEIIANKFHLTFESVALDCLEERHRNRTATFVGSVGPDFDVEYYKGLPTVMYSYNNGL